MQDVEGATRAIAAMNGQVSFSEWVGLHLVVDKRLVFRNYMEGASEWTTPLRRVPTTRLLVNM